VSEKSQAKCTIRVGDCFLEYEGNLEEQDFSLLLQQLKNEHDGTFWQRWFYLALILFTGENLIILLSLLDNVMPH
jgi:hypothetical protein